MEAPVAPWPPGTPRAATAGANAGVTSSRMSLRVAPTPPSAGSGGALRPLAESARDPRKILTSSISPPFTATSTPGAGASRLRPDPRHIGSPRTSSRPSRLNDSLSQSSGSGSAKTPGSAPSSLSVTWASTSPEGDADPAMSTLSREDKATFMRRYFFTERGYETDRMPAQKHFDVLMQDAPPEFAGDHLYCRYVDFMREGKEQPRAEDLGLIDEATNSPNTMVIAEWLRGANPRTRLDACPMFFLAKQILINLMDGEVASANQLREQANKALAELQDEHTAAMQAHADALDKAEDRYVDRETSLLAEIDEINAKLAGAETAIKELTGERDSSRDECAGLQKEIKRLGSVEQILLADLERNQEVQEGLKRELYETTVAVANAQAECAAAQQHGIELSNKVLRLTDWKEGAEADMQGLQKDLAASQTHVEQLKDTLDELNAAMAKMKAEMYDLNEEIAMKNEEAERLQRDSDRKLKAASNAGSGTTNELRKEMQAAYQREEELETELSNQRAEQRSLQRKLEEHIEQVEQDRANQEAEKMAHKEKLKQIVSEADQMAKLLTEAPALRTMSAGPDAPDWRKVEQMYREAVHENPESGDLKYKLSKAERNVQRLQALEYGDAALREDPSDFATALVAYKQAQTLSSTVDPELEFAIQIVRHGLTLNEANAAVQHGNTDVALKQYQQVLDDLSWVDQVETLLPEPEPEPENETKAQEHDENSATADALLDLDVVIEKAPASVVATLCADPARPYAYGRRLAQCREAARKYPLDPVVSTALQMAIEETERSAKLRNDTQNQMQVVEQEVSNKRLEIQEAERKKKEAEAASEAEKAAMLRTIRELELKVEDAEKALEEAKQAAAAQAGDALRAAEEAAAAQAAAAEAAEAEAADALGANAEDMSPEEQLAAVMAMQQATKKAQEESKEAIRKTTEEAAKLRAEHEVYERNAVAYKMAQQKLLNETDRWKGLLQAERERSAAALASAEVAAESARAAERLRFGQAMKGLSRILTMGLADGNHGFSAPDLEEMRQMLLLMVEGGKPMEDAMAAAAEKIAAAKAAEAEPPAAPAPAPAVSPPVETATTGCQTDYGFKRGYVDGDQSTPDGMPWDSPWTDAPPWGQPDAVRAHDAKERQNQRGKPGNGGLKKGAGHHGVRTAGQKKTVKTVGIRASYSKGKHGNIAQMPVQASSVWWQTATAPLTVELKSATPPPSRKAEWERDRPQNSKSAR